MRPFRKFFLLSLGFFLFLFFAKFLVLAFFAALIFTFVSAIVKKMRQASYYGDYLSPYDEGWLGYSDTHDLPRKNNLVEPLLNVEYAGNKWNDDHRSIAIY